MRRFEIVVMAAATLAGCTHANHQREEGAPPGIFMMQVELNTFDPPANVTVTKAAEISRIEQWLQEVSATQLPPEQIGNVIPWCVVTVFDASQGRQSPRTISIYSTRDRTTCFQLLSQKQRTALLNILHLKEPPAR